MCKGGDEMAAAKRIWRYNIEGALIDVPQTYDQKCRVYLDAFPDLIEKPVYTPAGERVLLTIEDACPYAVMVDDDPLSIDCGSCIYFRQPAESILGVCHNEKMRFGAHEEEPT